MTKKKETKECSIKNALELKKHVAIIHSSNRITLLQRKIANALLYNAYEHLQTKDEHQIHIGALCRLIGYDSNDHRTIKNSLVNLLSTVIEWNLVDGEKLVDGMDQEGIWNASSMIADASIEGPICTYSYSNKMKKLLYRPNMYGRLNMQVQAKFRSSYGLALYENCNRYQDIGQTPWFDLLQFRKLMGIEENKYKIFRDFKHRVLDKAVEEVNNYSTILIDPQLQKQNRKVIAIQFLIKQSHYYTKEIALPLDQKPLPDLLNFKFGLSKKQTDKILLQYDENYILEKINIIEASTSFAEGKIKNLAKYLLSALKDDYQFAKRSVYKNTNNTHNTYNASMKTQIDAQAVQQQAVEPQEAQIQVQGAEPKEESREAYRRFLDKQILIIFDNYSPEQKQQMLKEFEKYLGKSLYINIYHREGLKNILIRDQLAKFISLVNPHIMHAIDTYDKWLLDKGV